MTDILIQNPKLFATPTGPIVTLGPRKLPGSSGLVDCNIHRRANDWRRAGGQFTSRPISVSGSIEHSAGEQTTPTILHERRWPDTAKSNQSSVTLHEAALRQLARALARPLRCSGHLVGAPFAARFCAQSRPTSPDQCNGLENGRRASERSSGRWFVTANIYITAPSAIKAGKSSRAPPTAHLFYWLQTRGR